MLVLEGDEKKNAEAVLKGVSLPRNLEALPRPLHPEPLGGDRLHHGHNQSLHQRAAHTLRFGRGAKHCDVWNIVHYNIIMLIKVLLFVRFINKVLDSFYLASSALLS